MNLPNFLTILRIIMVPFFMFFLLADISNGQLIAAVIFTVAAGTDFLDGYIARKRNQITNFGKIMDPLADKLLVAAALISLVQLGTIPAWIVVTILGREFAVTGLRSVAASEGVVIAASNLGKYKTISQLIALILILVDDYILSLIGVPLGMYLLYIALFLTIYSGIDYFVKAGKVIKVK